VRAVDASLAPPREALRVSESDAEQRLASFFGSHVDAVFEFDRSCSCRAANARALGLTGFREDELVGQPATVVIPVDQRPAVLGQWDRVFRGETVEYHSIAACKDGRRVPVRVTAIPVTVGSNVVATYAVVRDITAERQTTTELIEYTDRIRSLNAVTVSGGTSARQQITDILDCGVNLLGLDCAVICKAAGDSLEVAYAYGDGAPPVGGQWPLKESLSEHALFSREPLAIENLSDPKWQKFAVPCSTKWRTYIGGAIPVAGVPFGTIGFASATPRTTPYGKYDPDLIESIGAIAGFAVERALHEEHLSALAFHDPLTGLANRALMLERLGERLAAARLSNTSVAVHFIDLDRFKAVNDTHGHAAGDEVLRAVGRRLDRIVREGDTTARLGGDEFVILQSNVREPRSAEILAQRIIDTLNVPVRGAALSYNIGASVGIALYPSDADNAEALIARADAALYSVKKSGRGRLAFAADARASENDDSHERRQ